MGVQNEYSGDLPKAFIVLVPSIAAEVAKSDKERVRVAKVISKVSLAHPLPINGRKIDVGWLGIARRGSQDKIQMA